MPNWCEGTLKVRGTKENIKRFVLEGLHPVDLFGDAKSELTVNEFGNINSNETCWIEKQEEDSLRVLNYIFQNTKMMKDSLQYLIPNLHGVLTLMNF